MWSTILLFHFAYRTETQKQREIVAYVCIYVYAYMYESQSFLTYWQIPFITEYPKIKNTSLISLVS